MRCLAVLLLLAAAAPALAQAAAPRGAAADSAAAAPASEEAAPAEGARAEADPATAPVYYAVARGARLYGAVGGSVLARLPLRDAVRRLGATPDEAWLYVQHGDRRGWVRAEELSNLWLRVDKSERTVYLYRGAELVRTFPADVSPSDADKVRRAGRTETTHHRIPEGTFYVTRRHDASDYYLAFVLSYPDPADAARGLADGLISPAEHRAIVRAHEAFAEPPMNTRLGGLIEIHGDGTGRRRAWTRGCIALRNVHMDELWELVHVGTPVVVQP